MPRFFAIFLLIVAPFAQAQTIVPHDPAQISLSFAPVVREAAPAVVNIYAKRVVNVRTSPFRSDPFFEQFFQDFATPRPRVQNSLGSGVILTADGIVVSNYHVVGEATDIRVVLSDGREFTARVLLSDAEADLAILQLDGADGLATLSLRGSDTVEVGELVLAIGNPFGVGQTVSSGIVSGLARSGLATGNARGYFIQTDAPINPGNSGGALVDINGHLIGINTSILSRSGGSNGIGFAIPSALVAQFVTQARAGFETFQRPWAGISGQSVTADLADGLGLDRPGGIIVSQLHPRSPFHAAGFMPGDVITQVDGQPVNTPAEMVFRMSVAGLGQQAEVTRIRAGAAAKAIDVDLIVAPDDPPRAALETGESSAIPGMRIANVNPAVMFEFNLPLTARGVVVETPGRIGRRAGLQRGDLLLSVNGQDITSTANADQLLRDVRRKLALEVQRGEERVVMRFRL